MGDGRYINAAYFSKLLCGRPSLPIGQRDFQFPEAANIGQHVDLSDGVVGEAKRNGAKEFSCGGHDETGNPVDEDKASGFGAAGEGNGLPRRVARALDLGRRAGENGGLVGAHNDFGIE